MWERVEGIRMRDSLVPPAQQTDRGIDINSLCAGKDANATKYSSLAVSLKHVVELRSGP